MLTKEKLIYLASIAIGKQMHYETFYYSDYMYDYVDEMDSVWEYVNECKDIGQIAWKEKYKDFKLYNF